MTKKDNSGEPIEFRITSGPGGRENVPIPVNRPNWKYGSPNSRSKPTVYEWAFIGLTTILIAAFIAVILPGNSSVLGAWLLSFLLALFPILWIISALSRMLYYSEETNDSGNKKSSKKRKKKFPKQRKDYK